MEENKNYRLMESRTDAGIAIEEVVMLAQRELRIFDISAATLQEREFGTSARFERLSALLRGTRAHKVLIVLHDLQGFETLLPRLINLQGLFSGQVAIHRGVGLALEAKDPLVIADDCHFWHKLHADHPRSVLTLHDAAATRPLLDRFESIWESSEPGISGGATGL
jgi:hypothetical protein